MKSVAELIEHLEAAQNGNAEIRDTPVLQAVNRQLAYRAKASKKAHQRVMQGIDDALEDARLFQWDVATDGAFPFDMVVGSEHGITGVVLSTDDYDLERTARLMHYDGGGRSGGGSLLIFPETDDGKFYVLSFRDGRTQYDIDIRAVWDAR